MRNRGYLHHTHETPSFSRLPTHKENSNGIVNEEELEREWNKEWGVGTGEEVGYVLSADRTSGLGFSHRVILKKMTKSVLVVENYILFFL